MFLKLRWYFFKNTGYIAENEFVQGYWMNENGTMAENAKYGWHKTTKGWWYGNSKWYAKSKAYTIDGVSYSFNASGYIAE